VLPFHLNGTTAMGRALFMPSVITISLIDCAMAFVDKNDDMQSRKNTETKASGIILDCFSFKNEQSSKIFEFLLFNTRVVIIGLALLLGWYF
jgi:hypothetical protein